MKNKKFAKFLVYYELDDLDEGLLRQAFTHSSVGKKNNERLEFLGDAVLDCILSEFLYDELPKAQEDYMTRLRAHLVNKRALAKIANELEFYDFIILGEGEKQTGGHKRDSNLADAFEALIGAIFLSANYKRARRFILEVYADELANLPKDSALKDPKTRLQEWLQKHGMELPKYKILAEEGKPHNKTFTVQGKVENFKEAANGKSRKQAEQKVAELLLTRFKEHKIKAKNKKAKK